MRHAADLHRGSVRSGCWRCGGCACSCAQTDRPGGAAAAADRAPGQHQHGTSSSRRPPPDRSSSARPSPAGRYASSPHICARDTARCPYRPRDVTRPARPPRRHLPAHQDVRRSPRIPSATPSSTASSTFFTASRTACSPSTSSAPWESSPPAAAAGPNRPGPAGCRRPTTAPTACGTSMAVTRSATTPCGVPSGGGGRWVHAGRG